MPTTTGLAEGQLPFFKNAGDILDSEMTTVYDITANTDFTIQHGLTNAQTGSTWYNRGEKFFVALDLAAITRLQVVCNNNVNDDGDEDVVNWRVLMVFTTALE